MKHALLLLLLVTVLAAAPIFGHSNNTHGNSPRVEATLDLMTYLVLLSPDGYDGFMMVEVTPLTECIDGAIATCGAGNVCYVCVVGNQVCSFQCRDADGTCPPPPVCDPVIAQTTLQPTTD